MADLAHPHARVVLGRGGRGGRGNARFVSPTRQVPRFAEVGMPGDERDFELRLKLLADAALSGSPTRASRRCCADLERSAEGRRVPVHDARAGARHRRVARRRAAHGRRRTGADRGRERGDRPGPRVPGAPRARATARPRDRRLGTIEAQFRTIDGELTAYGAGLDELPQIVALNKVDIAPDPKFDVEARRVIATFTISCATGEGIDEFRRAVRARPQRWYRRTWRGPELADFLVYRPQRRRGRRTGSSAPTAAFASSAAPGRRAGGGLRPPAPARGRGRGRRRELDWQ